MPVRIGDDPQVANPRLDVGEAFAVRLRGSDLIAADVDAYGAPRRPDRESDLPEAQTGTAAELENPFPRLGAERVEHRDSPSDEVVAPSQLLLNRS